MVSDEKLRFAVDYIRQSGVLHAERPADVDLMHALVVLAHTALATPDAATEDGWVDVSAEVVNEPENMENIREVIAEVFRLERAAAERN